MRGDERRRPAAHKLSSKFADYPWGTYSQQAKYFPRWRLSASDSALGTVTSVKNGSELL